MAWKLDRLCSIPCRFVDDFLMITDDCCSDLCRFGSELVDIQLFEEHLTEVVDGRVHRMGGTSLREAQGEK